MTEIPVIEFSDWFAWQERDQIPECHLPGLYALAHFKKPPTGSADPLNSDVVYIGQSCGQGGVKGRLNLFDRSATSGRKGHSGGRTYRDANGSVRPDLNVSVAVVPTYASARVRNAFILFVERKLIWEFSIAHGHPPPCNKH